MQPNKWAADLQSTHGLDLHEQPFTSSDKRKLLSKGMARFHTSRPLTGMGSFPPIAMLKMLPLYATASQSDSGFRTLINGASRRENFATYLSQRPTSNIC